MFARPEEMITGLDTSIVEHVKNPKNTQNSRGVMTR